MNALRDMLNEFYYNIPEHFRQPLINAINAAEENEEDRVLTPLSQLIINLDRGQNNQAVNSYMTNPVTRGSATRPFFFPHTLRENLYPEDVYVAPPRPTAPLDLQRSPSLPLFPEPALVPPPNPLALAMAMAPPPSLLPLGSAAAPLAPLSLRPLAALAAAEPDQALNAIRLRQAPQTLQNDLEEGEIYE